MTKRNIDRYYQRQFAKEQQVKKSMKSFSNTPEIETAPQQVYLAGKVSGPKWALAKSWIESRGLKEWPFISSDGSNHSEHLWGNGSYCLSGIPHDVKQYCIDEINNSVGLVAYVETPDSFGTIAEIAYTSATGKPQFLIMNANRSDDTAWGRMYDAYWFASNFPGVIGIEVDSDLDAARAFAYACDTLLLSESPIEKKLLFAIDSSLMTECQIQIPIGRYRVDFGFPKIKLAVECDGHEYHSTKDQRGRDASRDRCLMEHGWKTIRFTGTEIYRDATVCASELLRIYKGMVECRLEPSRQKIVDARPDNWEPAFDSFAPYGD